MDSFNQLLLEAAEIANTMEPVDMLRCLTESGDTESKKLEANKKKTASALEKIKKAIMVVATAIKNFCRSFVSKIKEIFASKETKQEFAEWSEMMKRFPELKKKKILFLDYQKYKKHVEEASAKFDKVANTHGTTEAEMKKAQEQFESAMKEEPPVKEMEIGDVFDILKNHALDSLSATGKALMDRAQSMTEEAGKLGIDITAEMAKDPHNAIRSAGYASIAHKGFAAAYQQECKVSTSWFQRGMKEIGRNFKDIGKVITTTGKSDAASKIERDAAKTNLKAMMVKSSIGGIAARAMNVRGADGNIVKGRARKAAAEGMEIKAGTQYTKANMIRKKDRAVATAKGAANTIGSLFSELKESVTSPVTTNTDKNE